VTAVVFAVAGMLVLTAALARATFQRARHRNRRPLSPTLAAELRVHKLACLREPAARVDLELTVLLGDGPPRETTAARLLRCMRHRVAPYGRTATRTRRAAPQP
jgi:hypothetical protein